MSVLSFVWVKLKFVCNLSSLLGGGGTREFLGALGWFQAAPEAVLVQIIFAQRNRTSGAVSPLGPCVLSPAGGRVS